MCKEPINAEIVHTPPDVNQSQYGKQSTISWSMIVLDKMKMSTCICNVLNGIYCDFTCGICENMDILEINIIVHFFPGLYLYLTLI